MNQYKVLFVCLGNICRSPLAKGVFQKLVDDAGLSERFVIDSCGTADYHAGNQAHSQTRKVAKQFGVSLEDHRARQVELGDFEQFDLIVAMDQSNLSDLKHMRRGGGASIICLREHDPDANGDLNVPDPYYGGPNGFVDGYRIIERSCQVLLEEIVANLK